MVPRSDCHSAIGNHSRFYNSTVMTMASLKSIKTMIAWASMPTNSQDHDSNLWYIDWWETLQAATYPTRPHHQSRDLPSSKWYTDSVVVNRRAHSAIVYSGADHTGISLFLSFEGNPIISTSLFEKIAQDNCILDLTIFQTDHNLSAMSLLWHCCCSYEM